jgi:hypothetical protein
LTPFYCYTCKQRAEQQQQKALLYDSNSDSDHDDYDDYEEATEDEDQQEQQQQHSAQKAAQPAPTQNNLPEDSVLCRVCQTEPATVIQVSIVCYYVICSA